jgi:hypothetical protein
MPRGDLRLDDVVAGAQLIALRMQEHVHTDTLMVVHICKRVAPTAEQAARPAKTSTSKRRREEKGKEGQDHARQCQPPQCLAALD